MKEGTDKKYQLVFTSNPDFEIKTTYSATLILNDGVFTVEQPITVRLMNVNDEIAPQITTGQVHNIASNSSVITALEATDEDTDDLSTLTWSIIPAGNGVGQCPDANCADSAEFATRQGSDGVWALRCAAGPKAYNSGGGQNVYQVRVKVEDVHGNSAFQDLRVTVTE